MMCIDQNHDQTQVHECQNDGCDGTWLHADNWSGRAECDKHLAAPEETVSTPGPVPMCAGTFAIYEDGLGGFMLVTDMPNHGGVAKRHIPAALVKMATGGGMISRRFAGLFGGTGDGMD